VTGIVLLVWALTAGAVQDREKPACETWQECRTLALEAAGREDFESFHDLAWRAVQRGPRNDPALMTMLARAQSLSGRPGDALVMLGRLAEQGVVTDAQTSEDFRRVRALPGWPGLEARLQELSAKAADVAAPAGAEPARPVREKPEVKVEPDPATATPPSPPAPVRPPDAAPPAAPEPDAKADAAGEPAAETLRFESTSFQVAGLAYDAVSNRFIIGDRAEHRLAVIGERSRRLSTLTGAGSAGFGAVVALEIDRREGDLWVISVSADGTPSSSLHKLQLISGRQLFTIDVPDGDGPARFADVTLTPGSSVLVLDQEGRRVFRAAPRAREIQLAAALEVEHPLSIAASSDAVAYVSHDGGLARVDLSAGSARAVSAAKGVDLKGLSWIRWHRGSIVGVQADDSGYRIVRIELDPSGRTARRATVVDRGVRLAGPGAVSLNGGAIYYLVEEESGARVVRKRELK
jgi:hypothetical protein